MDECEICGRPSAKMMVVELEGAQMTVCQSCGKGKRVLLRMEESKARAHSKVKEEREEEIVEGYGTKIRKAREALQLPVQVLAERINEKESALVRVEKEKGLPTIPLARKLERELSIKLVVEVSAEGQKPVERRRDEPITLWDAALKKGKLKKSESGE